MKRNIKKIILLLAFITSFFACEAQRYEQLRGIGLAWRRETVDYLNLTIDRVNDLSELIDSIQTGYIIGDPLTENITNYFLFYNPTTKTIYYGDTAGFGGGGGGAYTNEFDTIFNTTDETSFLELDSEYLGLKVFNEDDELSIKISATEIIIKDGQGNRGIVYDGNYRSNFVDSSLVDKKYVDDAVAAGGGGGSSDSTFYSIEVEYLVVNGDSVSVDSLIQWANNATQLADQAEMLIDTINVFTPIIAGFAEVVDTTVSTSDGYYRTMVSLSDTVFLTELVVVADSAGLGATPAFSIQGGFKTSLAGSRTNFLSSAGAVAGSEPVTTGERFTTFSNYTLPPGDYIIEFELSSITAKFTWIGIMLKGYRKNAD